MVMSFNGIKVQSTEEFVVCHKVVIKKDEVVELHQIDLENQQIILKTNDGGYFGWVEPDTFILLEDEEVIMAMLDAKYSC